MLFLGFISGRIFFCQATMMFFCTIANLTIKRPSPGWTPIPRLFNGLEKGAYRHSMPKRLVLQNSSLGRTRLTQNVTRGAEKRKKNKENTLTRLN